MQFFLLKEFVVFSKYMNVSRAARQLCMSQSNLSKHIRVIESEVGAQLVSRNPTMTLTPAGQLFLSRIVVLLNQYDETIAECRKLELSSITQLIVRKPTYQDTAAIKLYELLNRLQTLHPSISLGFAMMQREAPSSLIRNETVDAHLIYDSRDIDQTIQHYEREGQEALYLVSESLVAWLPVNHPIVLDGNGIKVKDLDNYPLLETNHLYTPLLDAIEVICKKQGFKPNLEIHGNVNSFTEMVLLQSEYGLRVFPASVQNDPLLKTIPGMTILPFDEEIRVNAFLLTKKQTSHKEAVDMLKEVINHQDKYHI